MRPPLRQLVLLQAVVTLVGVALPCLAFPPAWFAVLGLDVGDGVATLVLLRLLGAAFAALSVEYVLFLLRPQAAPSTRLVAIVANALVGGIVGGMIYRGTLADLPVRGKAILSVFAGLSVVLAVLLLVARGRPPEPPGLVEALKPQEPWRDQEEEEDDPDKN